jgi:hypothetical protein
LRRCGSGKPAWTQKGKGAVENGCALGNRPSTGSKRGRWAAGFFHNAPSAPWFPVDCAAEAEKEPRGRLGGPEAPHYKEMTRPVLRPAAMSVLRLRRGRYRNGSKLSAPRPLTSSEAVLGRTATSRASTTQWGLIRKPTVERWRAGPSADAVRLRQMAWVAETAKMLPPRALFNNA